MCLSSISYILETGSILVCLEESVSLLIDCVGPYLVWFVYYRLLIIFLGV